MNNTDDKILQMMREYMTFKNVAINTQQYILTTVYSVFKNSHDEIDDCINDILLDGKVTFSDIPQIIKLISSSSILISNLSNVYLNKKILLRYFIFYIIISYASRDIKYMPNEDLYKFYDGVFDLLLSKIAKVNCSC